MNNKDLLIKVKENTTQIHFNKKAVKMTWSC